jgi:hypothetical protein
LATLYFAGAKDIDGWCARKGDLHWAFPLDVSMVYSPKLTFITNGNNPIDVGLAPGETICFGSLEFITDRFGRSSRSPKEDDSCAVVVGMVHSGSSDKGSTALGEGGSSGSLDLEGAM